MFINIQGPPTKDPERRRVINLYLSRVAKTKRPSKHGTEKLDRKDAQQKRRRREAEIKREKADEGFRVWVLALYDENIRNCFVLSSDLISPSFDTQNRDGIMACRDWFQFSLPYDAGALGLSPGATNAYARVLLSWTFQPNGMVLHGLAVYRLCALPESQDPHSILRRRIEALRSKLIIGINNSLQKGNIDDVLIQAIVLAIAVDDYLGYVDFNEAHLKGLDAVVRHRGGFDQVGSSDPNMEDNLRQSTLMSVGLAKLNIGTKLRAGVDTAHKSVPGVCANLQEVSDLHKLPCGFRDLVIQGYLSHEMVVIILGFSDWLTMLSISDPKRSRAWRHPVPLGLSNLEKCIFLALICLADDMTAIGSHVSALLWRKPAQRVQMLLNEQRLWTDNQLIRCVIWLATVISTPRKPEITPYAISDQIRQKILRCAPAYDSTTAMTEALEDFFLPSSRKQALIDSWSRLLPGA